MFSLAGICQHLLLRNNNNPSSPSNVLLESSSSPFSNGIIIVDVRTMFDKNNYITNSDNDDNEQSYQGGEEETEEEEQCHDDELELVLSKESEGIELTKGFGKYLLKLFQRMLLQNVVLAAHGNLCGVLLKLHTAIFNNDPTIVSELWLLHPTLSTKFVNTHFVVTTTNKNGHDDVDDNSPKKKTNNTDGKSKKKKKKKKKDRKNNGQTTTTTTTTTTSTTKQPVAKVVPLNLVIDDVSNSRSELLRHFFPNWLTTSTAASVVQEQEQEVTLDIASLLVTAANKATTVGTVDSITTSSGEGDDESIINNYSYEPEYFNEVGKSMFMSQVRVEMSHHTKQYERKFEDITSQLMELKLAPPPPSLLLGNNNNTENHHINDDSVPSSSRHVGALVLRGNRCILVRSFLEGEWDGRMRIPIVERHSHESPWEAAIRAVTEWADVESDTVRILSKEIVPVPIYAPYGDERSSTSTVLVHLYPL